MLELKVQNTSVSAKSVKSESYSKESVGTQ